MQFTKKNLLLISSSSKIGGGPKHLFILEKLISEKFNIFYAMPYREGLENYLEIDRFLNINERKITFKDIFNLIRFIKKNKINVIHAHGKGAGVIARLIKLIVQCPLIYTFHGIHLECLNIFQRNLYVLYENLTGWIDTQKIFVSKSEKNYAISSKIYIGKKFLIINNGVTNMSSKIYLKNQRIINQNINIHNNKKNIISVCRLVKQKNIFEIIKISEILKSYNFLIVGGGELFEKAQYLIKKKNIKNVYMLGSKNSIYKYLYASNLFLSTSLYEGHPISVLEAMSVGLPSVLTNVVGNMDTINHGLSGYFYELGNIKMACKYILKILENKEIYDSFSKEAFKSQRQDYSLKKMKEKYIKLYHNII